MTHRTLRLAAGVGRTALGAVLGIGLAAAIALQPAKAFAQGAAAPTPQSAAARPVGDGPALWVVKDEDSTIYLFGTVHILRPSTAWHSERVERAFDSADQIWLEISNPDDQSAILPLIQQHGLAPDRPLSSLLSPEESAELSSAASTLGMPAAQLDMFRPWLAGLTLSVAPILKAGYDPQSGVELVLKARAEAAGKPIHGFETIDKQVRILAGLPEDEQLAFLRATLEAFDDATTELDKMVESWASGDVTELERLAVDELREQSEEVYQALLVRRNSDWAGQIRQLLDGDGTVFIAVGAAHLAGPDSVQNLLQAQGVSVDSVQ